MDWCIIHSLGLFFTSEKSLILFFLLPTRYYLTGDRFALPMTIDSRSKQTKTGVSLFRCVLFLLRILGSSNFKMFLSKVRTMHSAIIEILVDSLNAFVYKSFNVANNRNR